MSQPPRSATVEIRRPEHAKPMVAFLAVAVVCGFVFANGLRTPEAVVSILKAGAANVVAGTSLLHEPVLGSHIEERAEPAAPQSPSSFAPEGGAAAVAPAVAAPVGASGSGAPTSGHAFEEKSAGGNDAGGHQSGGAQAGGSTSTDKNVASPSSADQGAPGAKQVEAAPATQSPGQGHGQGKGHGPRKASKTQAAASQDRNGGHSVTRAQAKGHGGKARGKEKSHDKGGAQGRSRGAGRP